MGEIIAVKKQCQHPLAQNITARFQLNLATPSKQGEHRRELRRRRSQLSEVDDVIGKT
jgi:hypothetical protein